MKGLSFCVTAFFLGCIFSVQAEDYSGTLTGFATLPADTFLTGPPSGQFDTAGNKLEAPRFRAQPVQGFSSLWPAPGKNRFWALSDNGYGYKANSSDYFLRLYLLQLQAKTTPQMQAKVTVVNSVQLSDPLQKIPFLILNEHSEQRLLTGWDFDPESLVLEQDGSFWIGDEFGPFLLHFDASGQLLEAPIPLPDIQPDTGKITASLYSPEHPLVMLQGNKPEVKVKVRSSNGIEGLAVDQQQGLIYALLEGSLQGDPQAQLRIYEFDLKTRQFTGRLWFYPLQHRKHKIGELVFIGKGQFLVIERDRRQGEKAQFKKIMKIRLDSDTTAMEKTEVLDLLSIHDPQMLAGQGKAFRFPYVTIESVWPVASDTLLLCNDNNYPATGGRGDGVKDVTEFIWVKLIQSLR